MNFKVDLMMNMFDKLMSTEEKDMAKLVHRKGGAKTCLDDDKRLQELINELKPGSSVPVGSQVVRKSAAKTSSDLEDLKDDLHLEPKAAMEMNMEIFLAKFDLQTDRIKRDMQLLLTREGDRIIVAVTAGPHNKIVDPVSTQAGDFSVSVFA
jgi:hypothetical protein